MEFIIFFAFFFLFLIPLVLGIVIPIFSQHRKATGDVVNYDPMMRNFIYKVYMSEEEIIKALEEKYEMDELACTFDFERSVVEIAEYGSSREYFFKIQVCDGYSILKLNQVSLIGMQNYVPYKLNPFMISKLNAELIPFSSNANL